MELFVLSYLESQYFWTTVAFLILLGVMWRFVVPAVLATLDARAAKIAGDLDAAARDRSQAENVLADYAAKLAEARKEAGEIVSRARAEAEALANERVAQMDAELARKAEEAHKALNAAKEEALRAIQAEVADMTVSISEKLLHASVDAKMAKKLADEAISKGF